MKKIDPMGKRFVLNSILLVMMKVLGGFAGVLVIGVLVPKTWAQTSSGTSNPSPPVLATEAASRFVGGPNFQAAGVEVDAQGDIYVAGNYVPWNASANDPIPGPALFKLNPQFEQISSVQIDVGGKLPLASRVVAMAIDPTGNIYVTGITNSQTFPTVNAIQAESGGVMDIFLTKFDPDGNRLFSTYLGGSSLDVVDVLAVDGEGNAFLGGSFLAIVSRSAMGMRLSAAGPCRPIFR